MTQTEYIKRLQEKIKRLPDKRRREILEDIRTHFEEGRQDGMDEERLCAILGSPETLAREYNALHTVSRATDKPSISNVMRAIWAGIGMGMLNLIFALPVLIIIFSVWVSLGASGLGMGAGGFAAALLILANLIVPLPFLSVSYPAVTFFAAIGVSALGILLCVGMFYVSRTLGRMTANYVRANIDIVAGRRRNREKRD